MGTISVDGTRLKANASKHCGVSYQRSGELIAQLQVEVEQLLSKAEQADTQGESEPATLPHEAAPTLRKKAFLPSLATPTPPKRILSAHRAHFTPPKRP